MYGENVARYTADHLRTHIKDYLDEIAAEYASTNPVTLIVPKSIDVSSVVGGLIDSYDEILPQYGIDTLGKIPSQDDSALWSYEYPGQINGLIHGGSQEAVDLGIKRHERAIEQFIREHRLLHNYVDPAGDFSILEFVFATVDFSGAEDLTTNERSIWTAGFSVNCSWFTSESGPGQHGS